MAEQQVNIARSLPPYARGLGIEVDRMEGLIPVLAMDFSERVQGRPGYLHGGALSGLLEMAAIAALQSELEAGEGRRRIKPVNVTIEFMRGGTEQRTFAAGRVTRAGRRIANVQVEAWQDDREKPIATAFLNIALRD